MVRIPTKWSSNKSKYSDAVQYSSSTTQYSSSTVSYSSSTVSQNEFGKVPSAWNKVVKTPSAWSPNLKYALNQYPYDSATFIYDSPSQTYDGVNPGQSSISTKPLTAWTVIN